MVLNCCYLTCLIFGRNEYYLLWMDGGDFPDLFVSNLDGVICLALTENEAREMAQDLDLRICDVDVCVIEVDAIWPVLCNTKKIRHVSCEDCDRILNAWNIIEDIARTLRFKIPPFGRRRRRRIQDVYERVFVGADVLVEKLSRCEAPPRLTRTERAIARVFLSTAWKKIQAHKKWPVC